MTHSTPTSPDPTPDGFAGATKAGRWLCADWEKRFVARWVDRVPACVETWHLTLATLAWCALAVVGGALAAGADWRWLSLVSLALALQYATDLFDGAVGRHRETGLVRWGFYMDHLLDFVFLCSLFVAWGLALPEAQSAWGLALLGLAGAGMASSFLAFAATGEFRISAAGVGPTELRLAAIAGNQALVVWGPPRLDVALPAAVVAAALALACVVVANHRALWALDLELRARSADASGSRGSRERKVGTGDRTGDVDVGR